jgi:alkylation response protein AidB-like acyl-CoA dehydrogenase
MTSAGELARFTEAAETWLASLVKRRPEESSAVESETGGWGTGSDDVSVFHALEADEERALVERAMAWQRTKYDAGYGALGWPPEFGGAGRPPA